MDEPLDDQVAAALDRLMDRCRESCLWHMPKDFRPRTNLQAKMVLEAIARSGSREDFIEARKLLTWLLQNSK